MRTPEWARMRELEHFGVGNFSDCEVAAKTAFIHGIMAGRAKTERPFISVVVPAHKEEKYILATLRSLAEQTFIDCEFIIVSNGELAGNATQRIAEACGFRVIHDPVRGISRARQLGLEAACGEIVVTTDADTVHHSRWLECIAEIMSDPRIPCGAGPTHLLTRSLSARYALAFLELTMRTADSLSPMLVTGILEANSFFRRELALACGGYRYVPRTGEGMALFSNFRRANVPLIYSDDSLTVATSGRRQERQGALRWLAANCWSTTLQMLGWEGVDYNAYPVIR